MHCKSCKQYIRFKAKKCYHCGSLQSWRRHLDTPSFLIAFIASIIAMTPLIVNSWKGKFIALNTSIVKSDQRGLVLLLSNNGSIDAGVKRAYVVSHYANDKLDPVYLKTIDWELLKAKSSKLIVAEAKNGQLPIMADAHHKIGFSIGSCILTIEYVSSLNKNGKISQEYRCYLASISPKLHLD